MMFRLVLLLCLVLPALQADVHAAAVKNITPGERYELGQRYLKRGYYTKALEQFNRIRNYYRDDPYALKAEIAIADLHFKKSEWDQARVAYEDFQRLHPRHEDLDYVTFRIGLCLWKKAPSVAARDQTWTRQAVNTWSSFEVRYSNSDYLDEVKAYLRKGRDRLARKELLIGKFYLRRKAWRAAIGRLEGMVGTYPQATDNSRALAMLVEAYYNDGDTFNAHQAFKLLEKTDSSGRLVERVVRRVPLAETQRQESNAD